MKRITLSFAAGLMTGALLFSGAAVYACARRAHALTGESPESARQREGYSQSQGRHREVGSEGRRRQNAGL